MNQTFIINILIKNKFVKIDSKFNYFKSFLHQIKGILCYFSYKITKFNIFIFDSFTLKIKWQFFENLWLLFAWK